jgi:hypothetical protein
MWIKAFRASGQNVSSLALGLLMASYATEDGTGIRVSRLTLASMMDSTERTLTKYLNALIKSGWVKRAMVEGVESYRLAMPKK